MEAWQLAWIAYHGLVLLVGLIIGGIEAAKAKAAAPAEPPAAICYQELRPDGPAIICPGDPAATFTLADPDSHWMVRP